MAISRHTTQAAPDWTYRDAKRRLRSVGRRHLPSHAAQPRMDREGNRLVDCTCGWTGNAIGWASHLDHVVRSAIRD